MIGFIRRLFCFGFHEWEYSETHKLKQCRNCLKVIDLEFEDD